MSGQVLSLILMVNVSIDVSIYFVMSIIVTCYASVDVSSLEVLMSGSIQWMITNTEQLKCGNSSIYKSLLSM